MLEFRSQNERIIVLPNEDVLLLSVSNFDSDGQQFLCSFSFLLTIYFLYEVFHSMVFELSFKSFCESARLKARVALAVGSGSTGFPLGVHKQKLVVNSLKLVVMIESLCVLVKVHVMELVRWACKSSPVAVLGLIIQCLGH